MYNDSHITEIKKGRVVSFIEKMEFSKVALFKAFEHKDLEMNKHIAIVTYEGLTNYPNMYNAVWNGKLGVDYFIFNNNTDALNKMNELSNKVK